MNCFPDGTPLTVEDFIDIAVEAGHKRADLRKMQASLHKEGLIISNLKTMTADKRLDMMAEGRLILKTVIFVAEEKGAAQVDAEIFAFLVANKAS